MFCWSQTSCQERYTSHPYWMSSLSWTQEFAQGGIFSNVSSESSFYNANLAFVKYCSSDLCAPPRCAPPRCGHAPPLRPTEKRVPHPRWVGDIGAGPGTFNYNFRGSRIVAATIASLIQVHGLGSTSGARLLFGGCSAGGALIGPRCRCRARGTPSPQTRLTGRCARHRSHE